jgi:hypothetical protein
MRRGARLRMRPIRNKPTAGWLSRDDRQILLLWLLFVVILASSGLIGCTLADGLRPKRPVKPFTDQSTSDGTPYTGSILFVSADGDNCWQRFWDNQTGRQWDSGLVPCAPHSMILQPGYSSGGRVDAIRKGGPCFSAMSMREGTTGRVEPAVHAWLKDVARGGHHRANALTAGSVSPV